eukprot:TRINITY_DN15965_c0_g2_i1.p1 TRINITY_DN15965_c0_g2~~TRINITY_DN15965_c0_g2_i1.p1  ORF type:complete len:192 (+),score=24.81 TRINITY_DN15965_c0_g2_i1:66-641(+)
MAPRADRPATAPSRGYDDRRSHARHRGGGSKVASTQFQGQTPRSGCSSSAMSCSTYSGAPSEPRRFSLKHQGSSTASSTSRFETESRRIGQGAWQVGQMPAAPYRPREAAADIVRGPPSTTSRSTRRSEMDMMAMRVRELGARNGAASGFQRAQQGRHTPRDIGRASVVRTCTSVASDCDSLPLGAEWCTV